MIRLLKRCLKRCRWHWIFMLNLSQKATYSMEKDVKKNDMKKKILIIFFLMSWNAVGQTPDTEKRKVTVLLTNISLEEALTVLSISYAVQFSYSDDIVPTS